MHQNQFVPNEKILKNFADVLIKFALNSGNGVKKGEVVYVSINELAKPLLEHIQNSIIESGAHMILNYLPAEFERDRDMLKSFYNNASEEQLTFFPYEYIQARVNVVDHFVIILSPHDINYLSDVDQNKISKRARAWKPYLEMRNEKEYKGRLTWVLTQYPTQALANVVSMSLEEYWEQVIQACFLDDENSIKKHKEVMDNIRKIVNWLNSLNIRKLFIKGNDVELVIGLTEHHRFVGGSGRNIPSFEIFTSPDWRQTNGWIYFNQPLYRNGTVIKGIKLEFKEGIVINYSAEENLEALKSMLETDEGAKRIGEFSLTDKRFSRINKIMGNTLYDENYGGEYGNTHIALGQSYRDAIINQERFSNEEIKNLGFNDSAIHTDIISTSNREVIALLENGKEIVIYKDGEFLGLQ
ncbi:MAG: aminopeptidase [Candidatus Dojkabacteria bacterium]|nr:aminopeptidase [Candidatus Dojkabacteria bacterium]